ncbi:VolA/Pla-1 family phospholipase [Shewanella waksmanii]|uniref:VolA/Pla-1 family phospholipase n=1 Tax=Shewanella waksmanii TaxID=213783 RepID=UPI00048AC01F|nr:VolA/Pla-1 family phospholipase [Shewanella waksmanii]
MKNTSIKIIPTMILSLLFATGCNDNNNSDESETKEPTMYIEFSLADNQIPIPNDLFFWGSNDGTLNIDQLGDLPYNHLDGWSTTSSITLTVTQSSSDDVDINKTISIDKDTLENTNAVMLFEVTLNDRFSEDPQCNHNAVSLLCKIDKQLEYGVDYTIETQNGTIIIKPIKPLKPEQSYLYATTDSIQTSNGAKVGASSLYQKLKYSNKELKGLTSDEILLKQMTENFEKSIFESYNIHSKSINLTGLFTTQSMGNVIQALKDSMVNQNQDNPYSSYFSSMPVAAGYTVAEAMGLSESDGNIYQIASMADIYKAKLAIPIYSGCSTNSCSDFNDALTSHWTAQFDSPLSVLHALDSGQLSLENYGSQALSHGIDPKLGIENPQMLINKTWFLDDGKTPTDINKNLTKYNPLPEIKSHEHIDVLLTIPNMEKLSAFYAAQQRPFVMPPKGWPLAITLHGISTSKELVLSYAHAYTLNGIATISIDMPLHGSRSIDIDQDGIYDISATTADFGALIGQPTQFANGSPTTFINIASPLTTRDNLKQSVVDNLGLRYALSQLETKLVNEQQRLDIDFNNISIQGFSLGGIIGALVASNTIANPTEQHTNPFEISALSIIAPAGGLTGSFLESAYYGPLIVEEVTQSEVFQQLLKKSNTNNYDVNSEEYKQLQQQIYSEFIDNLAQVSQTAIDSVDPINFASTLAKSTIPIHLIEIVGNNQNKPDQFIPNQTTNFPLSGTEPLIDQLQLGCIDKTKIGKGAVRFSMGHHSSFVDPRGVEGVSTENSQMVTTEMQQQVSAFALSAANGNPTIRISDNSVIQDCLNP